jgi:hypothetical protein
MSSLHELTGNLWTYHEAGAWIAVATNGIVKSNGQAVMGAGQAKEAATRFPTLPRQLGTKLRVSGNVPHEFPDIRLITWPTKDHFGHPSQLPLILNSVHIIRQILDRYQIQNLYCPRPGCGLGHLRWEDVRAALADIVDERFIFVSYT